MTRPTGLVVGVVYTAAALLTAGGLAWTLWFGVDQPGNALAFGALIAVGEFARWGALPGEREPAPLGAAGALAYALLGECAGEPTTHGVLQVVAVVVAAALAGAVPHVARGSGPALDHVARRVLTVGFAAVCFQPLYNSGELSKAVGHGAYYAVFLLVLLVLTALCDAVLAAAMLRARTRYPYGPLLRDELRALLGIGSAVCATGAVMALSVAVAGLWALPVFCVPLLLTQLSFRRYAAVRTTYRQTIASLARATEIAGYTQPGHARRVAALSTAVGRELGLSGPDLTVLEYAALMHDIGQLSLVDPVPDGATAPLPVAEQRRIALLGGAVVRQTGVPAAVAVVVERQADPYREQPLPARIVRAVNAYDDLAGGSGGTAGGALTALERLRLGTGHDYQPEVVESLARVLARGGLAPVPPG
ncbi:metal-dependent phosphohydrolase [Streptomyces lunaelactis]|uniref:HD-GYP domain-containing protein n=1 Tax=Streptomyces lunaelactis TaxID=1535768 RepID=UPI0015849773|nr:metal-dependent phosphohydrolase [Streptomyces lunaelactis]NUK17985.1 metal-dependent phosphohydrolase [Streptomyces lunaelactis]NUK36850.1 metal-dependent phosphohydrolase [Streptomyces lunaelactis]NUK43444.1 metal-dependent phosphohydrolase [Streptomyces lunaelactis]NUK53001.1 metal-dependent phosphohydrolase [Streptomyces lunaelactis]